jgi:hypothetical protein
MTDTDWFPGKEADQLLVVQNINSKIGNYAAQLGLTAADVTRIQLLCQTFVDAVTKTYEAQETMEALVALFLIAFFHLTKASIVSCAS